MLNNRLVACVMKSRAGVGSPIYIGQVYDASSNLNYLNARYQDPARGEFLSQDPVFWSKQNLSDPQSLNSYSYGNDNPITNSDPTGNYSIQSYIQSASQQAIQNAQNSLRNTFQQFIQGTFGNFGSGFNHPYDSAKTAFDSSQPAPFRISAGAGFVGGLAANFVAPEEKVVASGPSVLYHYTNEAGMNSILDSGIINASTKALNPKDAFYGSGQYLSDIAPGIKSNFQLGLTFKNVPNKNIFTHFIGIDASGIKILSPKAGIYLVPGESALNILNKIISYGTN